MKVQVKQKMKVGGMMVPGKRLAEVVKSSGPEGDRAKSKAAKFSELLEKGTRAVVVFTFAIQLSRS